MRRMRTREHAGLSVPGFFTDAYTKEASSSRKKMEKIEEKAKTASSLYGRTKNQKAIALIDEEASLNKMSYGHYVAMQYAQEHSPNVGAII